MKKLTYIFIILVISCVYIFSSYIVAAPVPRLTIYSPSSGTVEVGGTIRYTVKITNATNVTLSPSDIRISGVSANISVEGTGLTERVIVLSNIQGSVGAEGYISYIAAGVATNGENASREYPVTSGRFTIVATVNNNPTPQNPDNNNNNTNPNPQLPPTPNSPETNNSEGGNNTQTPSNPENPNSQEPQQPEEEDDTVNPTMEVSDLSLKEIKAGGQIAFVITYSDDKEMGEITLNKNDFTLYGFTADIDIKESGNTRTITLSNIQGNLGGLKYVRIASKTAKDKVGNEVQSGATTNMFKIVDNSTKNKDDDWIENPNTGK